MTGDIEATIDLVLSPLGQSSDQGVLVWTNVGDGSRPSQMSFTGAPFEGSKTTSEEFVVSFTIQQSGPGDSVFHSEAGECALAATQATEERLIGTIECTDLRSTDGQVASIEGEFTAIA